MKTDVSAILAEVKELLDEIFSWIKELFSVFQKEEEEVA